MAMNMIKNILGLDQEYNVKPPGLYWRSHTFFITGTVGMGMFTELFLYGLIVPVIPYVLQDRIGIPQDEVQPHVSGMLTAYAAASVVFSPISGFIADWSSSRQLPFLTGVATLMCSSTLLYLGQTEAMLLIARMLQGMSAAVVWTVGLALCLDTVGPDNLGTTIGSIFSFVGLGTFIAPALGGIVYRKAGFIGVFWISVGILMIDLIMRLLVIEKKVAHLYDEEIKDPFADGGISRDEENDSAEQPLLGSDDKPIFLIPENQSRLIQQMPLLYCLKDYRVLSALFVALVQAILLGSFDATVATESQSLFNFTSLEAGLLYIPLGLCDLIFGPLGGWMTDKYGVKIVGTASFALLAPALISLRAVHTGGTDQIALFSVILGFCGMGLAASGTPPIVEASNVINQYHKANPDFFGKNGPYAQLYGLNSMVFCAGLAVGPPLAGALRDGIGYGNMNAVLGALCMVTSVICYCCLGGAPKWMRRSD